MTENKRLEEITEAIRIVNLRVDTLIREITNNITKTQQEIGERGKKENLGD